uniref:Outer membrane protein beta-barrel domain-containing protein n=1 Tax=Ignavibacterium album TaxID=591197 RepID=A0A832DI56_9BACT
MKSIYYLLTIIFLAIQTQSFAQEDTTKTNDEWKWRWEDEDKWDWKWNWDDDFDFGFSKSRPAITLNYGLAQIDRKNMNKNFVKPNLLELKLGYIKENSAFGKDNLVSYNYRNVFVANESNKISGKEANGTEIESDMWRLGFERIRGYGYKLGESSSIILFNGYTLNWSRVDFKYPEIFTLNVDPEIETLNLYDENFRFGTSGVGGVGVKVIDNLMLNASYERSIIFQRHLFWKWAGSAIIESAAQGLLDKFVDEIFESSPYAGPIVSFVLKNALTYGVYELRKDKMNWPFKSESPLTYDQFKFGLTFVF